MEKNIVNENNDVILRAYENILIRLKELQSGYESMLESDYLNEESKDIVRNHLMEVDYQLRDYRDLWHLVSNSSGLDYVHVDDNLPNGENVIEVSTNAYPLYLEEISGIIPIIKSEDDRVDLNSLEIAMSRLDFRLNDLKDKGELVTDQGLDILKELVKLKNKQTDIISSSLSQESKVVNGLTRLREYQRVSYLLKKLANIEKSLVRTTELLEEYQNRDKETEMYYRMLREINNPLDDTPGFQDFDVYEDVLIIRKGSLENKREKSIRKVNELILLDEEKSRKLMM